MCRGQSRLARITSALPAQRSTAFRSTYRGTSSEDEAANVPLNRRALVTGAAAGLAAGIAPAFARGDFGHIAISYRKTPPDATCAAIEAAGARSASVRIDFLDPAEVVIAALDEAVRTHGPFDTLVHGVGPIVVKRFARASLEDYREVIDGNLRSAVLAARATLPAMRESGFGRIVFFGMVGSSETRPFRGFTLYQAAKSGLVAFARCLAIEEAGNGITVNVVSPGAIRDKSIDRTGARAREARNPRGRAGSYEDVADAVRFLVAAERDFVTGSVIEVTGGLQTAQD
ncbi:MAG: SDR family oxidoreductase [Candidatus Eremiobacteraeota bacterium]|nr:SDR family oxidoreductase [Candidatus Eremiobacteraeota bacterium]